MDEAQRTPEFFFNFSKYFDLRVFQYPGSGILSPAEDCLRKQILTEDAGRPLTLEVLDIIQHDREIEKLDGRNKLLDRLGAGTKPYQPDKRKVRCLPCCDKHLKCEKADAGDNFCVQCCSEVLKGKSNVQCVYRLHADATIIRRALQILLARYPPMDVALDLSAHEFTLTESSSSHVRSLLDAVPNDTTPLGFETTSVPQGIELQADQALAIEDIQSPNDPTSLFLAHGLQSSDQISGHNELLGSGMN